VNGQLRPVISMPGNSTQMWRIANTAGRAGIYFDEPAGIRWKQIAQDGVQYSKVNYADPENLDRAFLLASGNRADLLVQAPAFNAAAGADNTYEVQVFNTIDEADRPPRKPNVAPVTLLTVQVTANEEPPSLGFMPAAPPFPDFLKDIKDEEISGTKVITFASSALGAPGGPVTGAKYPSQQTIDGKKFDGELGVVVALNRAEEWKIVNETYPPGNSNWISHPFHIHINPFQISEIFDPNAVLSTAKGDGTVSLAKIVPVTTPTKPPEGNQSTITGVGTDFERDFKPGSWIWIESTPKDPANMAPSMVSRVVSKTELIIDNAPGAGRPAILPGATYRTVVPLYTIDRAKARPDQCVLDPNDPQTWKPCKPTVPATDRIWWDVFSIPSGSTFADAAGTVYNIPGYFKMRSRFVDYSGYYVIHCHILAHEDRGMMTVVEVAPLQTPYSHH
jgi:FtsP/CotA-like multicopper oxidase with cupredoxin domain